MVFVTICHETGIRIITGMSIGCTPRQTDRFAGTDETGVEESGRAGRGRGHISFPLSTLFLGLPISFGPARFSSLSGRERERERERDFPLQNEYRRQTPFGHGGVLCSWLTGGDGSILTVYFRSFRKFAAKDGALPPDLSVRSQRGVDLSCITRLSAVRCSWWLMPRD